MHHSLEVYHGTRVVFSSQKHWLHPLLDLEDHLSAVNVSPAELSLRDRIVGKASAMLITRMGFLQVHAETMSRLASAFFQGHRVSFTYDTLVDRIACRTEDLLREEDDLEAAYRLVRDRAGR
jgi:zinc transport system ATP-binding protein